MHINLIGISNNNYIPFRRFADEAGAQELTEILKKHNISFIEEVDKGIMPVGISETPTEYYSNYE